MPKFLEIYGTRVALPEQPPDTAIAGYGLPREEQMWERKELPSFFDDIDYDKNGNAVLTYEQQAFATIEVERCKKGYWLFINGEAVFITGKNYFYWQYWKLEDDIYPDARIADVNYFLYLDHWERVLWCLGVARGKKRREGASSQATSNLIYECIFYTSSNTGLVSKTEDDSKSTFTEMVANGYNQLPIFLKPRQLNRPDSVTEFVFAAKITKGAGTNARGNRSKINYRAPVENAYDRGRMSRVLADEGGKWPLNVKFSKFISKVSKTLAKGAKRVGFCEAPSTVNEMTKGGGKEFKVFWDGANQFKTGGRKTSNRFVTYFTPAYDNYEGFIDQYGYSVIDAPTEEQYNYLVEKWVVKDPITGETVSEINENDIKLGARMYVYSRREGLSGELLEEEIRQNPCTVDEMFEAANTGCAFNSYLLNVRRKELEEKPIASRKSIFFRDLEGNVQRRDINKNEESFHWKLNYIPPPEKQNLFFLDPVSGLRSPGNTGDGVITVDSYSNSQGGRKYGSKASGWIGRKADSNDPANTGKAIGHLYGRPAVKEMLHEQIMMAAEFFGYEVYYEFTADDYLSYFRDRGKVKYLGRFPLNLIDPNHRKDADRYKGTPITPFSLTKQLDNGIAYVEYHSDKIDWVELIDNLKIFDPYNRTESDAVVSWLMLISCLMEPARTPPPRKTPLVEIYENPYFGRTEVYM